MDSDRAAYIAGGVKYELPIKPEEVDASVGRSTDKKLADALGLNAKEAESRQRVLFAYAAAALWTAASQSPALNPF